MFKPGDRVRIVKEDKILHQALSGYIGQEVYVLDVDSEDAAILISCEGWKQAEELKLKWQWILPECLELV